MNMDANKVKTLQDIQQFNATVKDRAITDVVMAEAPAFSRQPARTIAGTVFSSYLRTSIPRVGFRKANDGADGGKASYEMKNHECFILDHVIKVDEKVLQASSDGEATVKGEAQIASGRGLLKSMEYQTFYGKAFDGLGFFGFRDLIADYMTISADPAKNVDNAANRADNSGASAYLVVQKPDYMGTIYGRSQGIKWSPWTRQYITGNNGKDMVGWMCDVSAWIGAYSKNPFSIVRIKNLDETHVLTDNLIQRALALFQGATPTAIYTTFAQDFFLQDSRTAKTVFVNPVPGQSVNAPVATTYQGWLPIIPTHGLLDDESDTSVAELAKVASFTAIKNNVLKK